MTEKKYLKNIRLYPHYRLWVNMMIIGPVLIPFMLFKGLNYTQILLLQSISAVAVFLFEIPTGAIADKLSRKSSLMMGSLCMALGLVIYILFRSFYFFALAEIIFGLGITF
ncbi:MAG TPA: MFS transporter, partial [Candidatus Cloacimonadota bacterium]|nr:MFS transporter [Candidatus Cloacimonadota bacterium]